MITATLNTPSALIVTVTLGKTGTAIETSDYTLLGTIMIPAGSQSASVTLTAVVDTLDENNETVVIDITGVQNGTELSTQQQTVTITDNTTPPTVTLTVGSSTMGEASATSVTATLSALSALPAVSYTHLTLPTTPYV